MSMLKTGLSIGLLAFAFAAASTAYADDPDVVAMHATFITKTNTNAQDPSLDIKIYDNKNNLVAENDGVPGQWGDNSINSISLDLKKPFKKSDLSGGKVELNIHPGGTQTWNFDYNISTTYSDNSLGWNRWNGKELSKAKPKLDDSLKAD
jgi:hypothetical protein